MVPSAGQMFWDSVDTGADDKEYTSGKNGESSALTAGSVVFWDITAADGITFKLGNAATNLGLCAGVLEEDVPAGAYTSKIVTKGTVDAFVLGHASLVAGSTLKPVASQRYLTYSAASHTPGEVQPSFVSWVAYATTSEALKSVHIRL